MNDRKFVYVVLAVLIVVAIGARADVVVSLGYYDLPKGVAGNPNSLPNPWYGSPNTTFIGDTAVASSPDPDESGILFTNTGAAAVIISNLQTTGYVYNGSGAWLAPVVLAPGQNLIYSTEPGGGNSFDGSDTPPMSGIQFSVNGVPYIGDGSCNPAVDIDGCVDGYILNGSTHGSGNETLPWTQVKDISFGAAPVPEPGSLALFGSGLFGLAGAVRRKLKK